MGHRITSVGKAVATLVVALSWSGLAHAEAAMTDPVKVPAQPAAQEPAEATPETPIAPEAQATPEAEGDALFQAGDFAGALRSYTGALKADPRDLQVRHKLALSALLTDDPVTAEREALVVVKAKPGDEAAADVARLAHQQRRRAQKAEEAQAPPPGVEAVEGAVAEGRPRAALALSARARGGDLNREARGRIAYAEGQALLAIEQAEPARRALTTAAALGAGGPEIWFWLAEASVRMGARERARRDYGLALQLLPEAHPLTALARSRLGRLAR